MFSGLLPPTVLPCRVEWSMLWRFPRHFQTSSRRTYSMEAPAGVSPAAAAAGERRADTSYALPAQRLRERNEWLAVPPVVTNHKQPSHNLILGLPRLARSCCCRTQSACADFTCPREQAWLQVAAAPQADAKAAKLIFEHACGLFIETTLR